MLRVLWSRIGKPHIGSSNAFSFNIPTMRGAGSITVEKGIDKEGAKTRKASFSVTGGMCPRCEGMGRVSDIDLSQIFDDTKSLKQGAITVPGYTAEGWYVRFFTAAGIDPDKPIRKFTKKERDIFLYDQGRKIKVQSMNLTYEGLIPRIRKSFLSRDVDAMQPHIREFVERAVAFATSGRTMRVFGAVVQIPALSMFNLGKDLALRYAVASQLVGHDHPRHVLQALQQPAKEALGGFGIPPLLHENVEYNTILIHGAPEVVLHPLDANEHLVHVPLVPRSWPPTAQTVGEALAELLAPAPHRLIGNDDAPLSQKKLNVPQAEAEHVIQPDGVADDLSGEPMAIVGVGWRRHPISLIALRACCQTRLL
jgi:hypothetical protein